MPGGRGTDGNDAWGLIKVLVLIFIFVVLPLLGKLLGKKRSADGGEDSEDRPAPDEGAASPEAALERMVREERQRRAQQPSRQRPVPVARPVPRARLVAEPEPPRIYRRPTVRKPAPPVVRLRRPQAAFHKAAGPTVAAEQSALMAQSKARVLSAAALAGPEALKAAQASAAAKPPVLAELTRKWSPAEAAKAIAYLEIFGPPRALRPHSGPPAAG